MDEVVVVFLLFSVYIFIHIISLLYHVMKTKMFNVISLALFSVPGQSLFPVCPFPIQYPFVFSD